jgi:sec-independent protein translocase protein TatA
MAPLAILGLSVQELVIILLIVVVLFGARRIPEIMRGLGQGVSSFKKGLKSDDEEGVENKADDSNGSPTP